MDNIKYPKISILLAIYKPNMKWLLEQLKSLNNQTYPNLELLVWDDCPEYPTSETIFKENISNFNYKLYIGDRNYGSNVAFEKLTIIANGKYFAYCDQDDIWMYDKLEKMYNKIVHDKSVMVCCDMNVIDGEGNKIANKISEVYKWHEFYEGECITSKIIAKNFVTGCAMIVDSMIAKKAVPFIKELYHDGWLGIIASYEGKISIIKEPLIKYRIHGNNQTSVNNNGIYDKNTYYKNLLLEQKNRINAVKDRIDKYNYNIEFCNDYINWINARESFYRKNNYRDLKIMYKYKDFGSRMVLFETVLKIIPNFIVIRVLELTKKGIL